MQLSESTLLDHSADADAPWQGEAAQIEHAETAAPNASGLATIAELGKAAGAGSRSPIWHTGRIRKADILMFTSQLSIMCESGVDLAEALRDSADNCRHPRLKGVLDEVYHAVANDVHA